MFTRMEKSVITRRKKTEKKRDVSRLLQRNTFTMGFIL